jgi:hypothetical protein
MQLHLRLGLGLLGVGLLAYARQALYTISSGL